MGLDIYYYSNLVKYTKTEDEDEDELYDKCAISTFNTDFKYQLGSLEDNTYYMETNLSKNGHFRAGSYGSYGYWRNMLAQMAGYETVEKVWNDFDNHLRLIKLKRLNNETANINPFYELINFSDAEGSIGPEISKKLYDDFVKFDNKALEYAGTNNKFFYELYCYFKKAFEVASENGAVSFH